MNATLAGKTIFISGGSRGIGLAIAMRAARDGANVAIAAKTAEPHPSLPGTIYTAARQIEEVGGNALPLRSSGAPGSSGTTQLRFGYAAFGNQLPRTRDQAWGESVIHTEQAQTDPREAFLMFGNLSRVRERGQFCDEKPRVNLQPVFMAAGRPQDSGLNGPALKRYHERRSYLVELLDEDVRAAEQPADCGVLPQRAHDHPSADAGKQFDALRPFKDAAGPIRDPLQRRRDERSDDLVDRFEVIVKRAIRDVRLLGDVVDGRTIDSLAAKNEFGRDQDGFACPLAPAVIAILSCG